MYKYSASIVSSLFFISIFYQPALSQETIRLEFFDDKTTYDAAAVVYSGIAKENMSEGTVLEAGYSRYDSNGNSIGNFFR